MGGGGGGEPDSHTRVTNVFSLYIFFTFLCHFPFKLKKICISMQNLMSMYGAVMSIFTKTSRPAKMMFGKASSPFCIPVTGQC